MGKIAKNVENELKTWNLKNSEKNSSKKQI